MHAPRTHPDVKQDGPFSLRRPRPLALDRDAAVRFARVGPLLDRMRAAFFGLDPDPAPIDLPVTPWHVRSGSPVTVDVPQRASCDRCQGRGEIRDEPCAACRTTGLVMTPQPTRLRLPIGVQSGETVRFDVTLPDHSSAVLNLRVVIASS